MELLLSKYQIISKNIKKSKTPKPLNLRKSFANSEIVAECYVAPVEERTVCLNSFVIGMKKPNISSASDVNVNNC